MKKHLAAVAFIVILIGALFFFYPKQTGEPGSQISAVVEPLNSKEVPAVESPPEILYPVAEVVTLGDVVIPLPELDESDTSIETQFNELVDNEQLSELLLFKTFIRNFVVIVDNLNNKILPQRYYFFRPPPGKFMVNIIDDDRIFLDPENYRRYDQYIKLIDSLDMNRLVNVYSYLYPLIQEAYVELGYPDGYFNDRLIEVIDVLLQTPEIDGPIELIEPTIYYKFADPELEALSAGQKILIRLGPENTRQIKMKLRQVQGRLKS